MQFTPGDRHFRHIDALNKYVNLKDYKRSVGIDIDNQGRVWLATYPKGIIIYNPSDQSVQLPFPGDSLLQHEVSDANYIIYCDKDGIAWSGFWLAKGIYQLIPFSQAVIRYTAHSDKLNSLSNNEIYNCINGADGKVWIGTGNGLNIFDPQTGSFKVLYKKDLPGMVGKRISPKSIDTLHSIINLLIAVGKRILPISIDTVLQKAWLSNYELPVLYEMDIRTNKCRSVIFKDSANSRITNINFIFSKKYKRGCVILASCTDQQRIFIVNGDSAIAHQILSFPKETINGFNTTEDDQLLFLRRPKGMLNLTYTNLNGKWIQIHNILDTIQWSNITFSKADQTYWVVADRELIHYYKDFSLIRHYTREDGLPENEIYNIITDNRGNVWFNTGISILQLNIQTGVIMILLEKDGFQKQDFDGTPTPAIKDIYGNLYFPAGRRWGKGFDRVTPDKFRENYPSSAVYLKSVEISQSPFPLATGINNLQDLKLKYFQNNISLETGIIDYYSKGASRIRYKLEGINDHWQYAPANYTIRYDGLPPGKYKLIMQACNAANEFNGPVKSIFIQITPPFWKTWWFISLVILIIVIAVNALFQFRLKQKMQVLNVRQKLHRDLHDDVGATLSSVKIYSEILQTNLNNPLITELIKNNASDMIDKLEVIAWATNPQHDTFKSFKELINKYAAPVCYAKNIDLNIHPAIEWIIQMEVLPEGR